MSTSKKNIQNNNDTPNSRNTMSILKRALPLLLAGGLLFSTAGAAAAEEVPGETGSDSGSETVSTYYAPKEHADMDYADMVYTQVDPHALDGVLAEIDAVTDGTQTADDLEQRTLELYHEIQEIMTVQYTNYVLGDIEHYRHVNDEELNEKNRLDTLAIQDMSDAAYVSLQKAMTGPYGSALQQEFSEEQLSDLEEYQPLTDRERELTDHDTELQQKYDQLSEKEYTFEYNGKTWTMDDLYSDPPESQDDVVAVYLGLSKAMNDEIVPVYQDMVKTRKEIAEEEGYDTYTDFCYEVNYGRDFTGEDIAALRETIIRELKPLYEELRMMQLMSEYNPELAEPLTGEEIVDTLAEHIGDVHPELTEAFDYLREHNLYYIDNTDEMVNVGFTSDLPEYGSAFIYDKTDGTVHDLETIVHEFGHFNAAYHAQQNVLMDSLLVDVAEIQSQGLEMLFLDEMEEILPDDPEGLQLYMLVNMLDSVLTGFEYDEFQQEVYAGEEMTQEELNRLAKDVDEKYTQYFYDDEGQAYEWVLVNHTFSSPLYYIGYATSALSALDIWAESLDDRDAAIDKYMKLSAVPLNMPYQEATTSCGLRNMLEPESIRELAAEIREWADKQPFGLGDLGIPGFDFPFGFGEDGGFGWEGTDPMEPFKPDTGENPVTPYEYETEPGPDGEAQPSGPDGNSGESGSGEYPSGNSDWEQLIMETRRQTFKTVSYALIINAAVRFIVLIIALYAFFHKKKDNQDNSGSSGGYSGNGGGWNGPSGGSGSSGDWNDRR